MTLDKLSTMELETGLPQSNAGFPLRFSGLLTSLLVVVVLLVLQHTITRNDNKDYTYYTLYIYCLIMRML